MSKLTADGRTLYEVEVIQERSYPVWVLASSESEAERQAKKMAEDADSIDWDYDKPEGYAHAMSYPPDDGYEVYDEKLNGHPYDSWEKLVERYEGAS